MKRLLPLGSIIMVESEGEATRSGRYIINIAEMLRIPVLSAFFMDIVD